MRKGFPLFTALLTAVLCLTAGCGPADVPGD